MRAGLKKGLAGAGGPRKKGAHLFFFKKTGGGFSGRGTLEETEREGSRLSRVCVIRDECVLVGVMVARGEEREGGGVFLFHRFERAMESVAGIAADG
jgi:hypothetical protein